MCIRAGLTGWTTPECRLVSVPFQKSYYANDPWKTKRRNLAIGRSGAKHGRENSRKKTIESCKKACILSLVIGS